MQVQGMQQVNRENKQFWNLSKGAFGATATTVLSLLSLSFWAGHISLRVSSGLEYFTEIFFTSETNISGSWSGFFFLVLFLKTWTSSYWFWSEDKLPGGWDRKVLSLRQTFLVTFELLAVLVRLLESFGLPELAALCWDPLEALLFSIRLLVVFTR